MSCHISRGRLILRAHPANAVIALGHFLCGQRLKSKQAGTETDPEMSYTH